MGTIAQLVTLLGTTAALLALFAEGRSRHRRAIRETLELSAAFVHDDELSQRFRERADAMAGEYLAEVSKAKQPTYVSIGAGIAGIASVLVGVEWFGLDVASSPGEALAANVVAGLAAGTLGLLLREPVGWLAQRAVDLRLRFIGWREARAQPSSS
jgi:hypothetical protein